MSFGERFKEAREQKKFNQQELADILGVTDGTISNYEKGVAFPRWDMIKKVCDVLHVDPNYLFWDDLNDELKNKILEQTDFHVEGQEKQLIEDYRTLSNQGKEYILQTMNMAVNTYKKDNSTTDTKKSVG